MDSNDSEPSLESWLASDPDAALSKIDAEICRRSLAEYFRAGWHVLEPGTPLADNWHIDAICDHVQALLEDWAQSQADAAFVQRLRNLLINVPPGTAKSRIVSVYAPTWAWLRWPAWRSIFLSSNPRVALRDAGFSRYLIESDWYQRMFRPEWTLSEDTNAKGLFKNTAGGWRLSMGIMSRITGDRADALFIDDPHDAEEVKSRALREAVTEKYKSAIANRINDLRKSVRCGIMQRLHDKDWSDLVLKEGWEHLCLRMEFDPTRTRTTAIGWSDPRTEKGELLFPERFPPAVLATEKKRLGSEGYAGQHQQDPMPEGGGKFKRKWFVWWAHVEGQPGVIRLTWPDGRTKLVRLDECRFFGTVDLANSVKKSADYTVFSCWAVTPQSELILIDLVRERLEDPDIVPTAIRLTTRWKLAYLAVETNGLGLGVVQTMRRANLAVRGVLSNTDKVSRASTAIIRCEAGQIAFPVAAEWLDDFEHELTTFPNGTHDDQVDTVSLAAIDVFWQGGAREPDEEAKVRKIEEQKKKTAKWHSADNDSFFQ